MNKRYENKSAYDPGRFRYKISFRQQVTTSDGSGGSNVSMQTVLETKSIRIRLNQFTDSLFLAGNASLIENSWNFIIRNRPGFIPTKDMFLLNEGETYTIRAIQEIDEPTNYIKILAVKVS